MYDTAIIGTGPAGLSAAINLKQLNRTVVWFGSPDMSVKVGRSELIANYPGAGKVNGAELNERFRAHAGELGLEITDRMVTNITVRRKGFMLLADNEIYEAKSLILAVGAVAAKGYPGETELLGRGVSYCATCDGFLYKGKTIAVCCFDKRYEHEVDYLAGLAEKVYLFTSYPTEIDLPNVERLLKPVQAIEGGLKTEKLRLTDGSEVSVDGVFILRSAVAPTTLLSGLETDGPHIVTGRELATSVPGCFACGDCTGRPYQIAKAVGEGNIAAHSVVSWLAEKEKAEKTK